MSTKICGFFAECKAEVEMGRSHGIIILKKDIGRIEKKCKSQVFCEHIDILAILTYS